MNDNPCALDLIPVALLDDNGYPTDEWLAFLKTYQPDHTLPILSFVNVVLSDGWYYPDWGFDLHRKYKGKTKFELHTGGWSGNEDIIRAILSNIHLTHFAMKYYQWRSGGHYYFEIIDKP